MSQSNSPYLTTVKAAEYLGVIGKRSLERFRMQGGGPRYSKIGRQCVYTIANLDAWIAARTYSSTAEGRRAGVV
jgi:Helix-turn-helix domain